MIPPNIVRAAQSRGLDVIGITDHNTGENVAAVREAAVGSPITVIGGMEVATAEEAHVLVFFDGDAKLAEFQQFIYEHLHGGNDPDKFGHQWVVDAEGSVVDVNPRLLAGATTLVIEEVVAKTHDLGGIAIAAHVDRQSFSIVSQLGFIPEALPLDGIELSPFFGRRGFGSAELAAAVPPGTDIRPVRFSDAHYTDDVGRATTDVLMADATVAELRHALRGEAGRSVRGGV